MHSFLGYNLGRVISCYLVAQSLFTPQVFQGEFQMSYLWTSEAVAAGHPDKVADQIADGVLDAYLAVDPTARVACEVTVMKDLVLLTGETSSECHVDIEKVARDIICDIGYDRPEACFDGKTVPILNKMNKQSPEIARAVTAGVELGAGDQGMMFGFACNETPSYMPLAHNLAFQIINALEQDRKEFPDSTFLLPDAKSQVTIQYSDEGEPEFIHTIVASTQHKPGSSVEKVAEYLSKDLIPRALAGSPWISLDTKYLINPGGEWNVGGPASDTGLSGRKIVVDNYGSDCPIGGGSFSGKDPTKVDRSAAYAARHLAKNIVAAGLANKARVQVAYAIGVSQPVSLQIDTTRNVISKAESSFNRQLGMFIWKNVPLTPQAIIDRFDLRRPIYRATAAGGHFGRNEFPWEQLQLVQMFKNFMEE